MIYIDRSDNDPDFWRKYRQKNASAAYNDLEGSDEGILVRTLLREHNVKQQHYLCAYCCRRIETDGAHSLNEHIRPQGQSKFQKHSMDYGNIIACCQTEETCSAAKKNQYDENLFISPLDEDCEMHFSFGSNGEVFPESERGEYTINLLNLNSYRLKQARAAQYKACTYYGSAEEIHNLLLLPDIENKLAQFADMIRYCFARIAEM